MIERDFDFFVMKALYFNQHGGLDKLIYGEVDTPTLGPTDVKLRVKACALNHLDLWVLQGWPGLKLSFPHIGGSDIAGVVEEVGAQVTGWKKGDAVVVCPGVSTAEDEWTRRGEESVSPGYKILGENLPGGFAEYINVPAKNLLHIPSGFSFEEACAPLLASVTAWRMLTVRAQLKSGETVLIVGAGGGLNSFALQLAKLYGAKVIALTSSKEKEVKAKELGAHLVINYKDTPEWAKAVLEATKGRGADVVVDNVGAATMPQSLKAVSRGGRIVTVGNTNGPELRIDNRYIFTKQISILGSTMGSFIDFKNAMQFVWSGQIKPVVDRTLPLEKGHEGYAALKHGEQFGKVVLIP